MSDLYKKIVSERSGLEKIIAKIPGFRGYKEMTARREADRLIREHVVRQLKDQMQALIGVEKKMISSGGLSLVSKVKSGKLAFQTFIDRVNTAAPGYSGFYDSIKVGSDELEKIYAFDAAMVRYADQMREIVMSLEAAVGAKDNDKTELVINALDSLASEANAAFGMREDLLTGLA
ncbi:MAG TPA: hypothetical protein PLD47_15345 [Aggregatilineales bacterium]|nr:hypothetical protein [Anaerolineales bacterium]HRE49102.1 hypothetical protein [Aggregatilineales bacterium]